MDIPYPATVVLQKDGSWFVQFIDLIDTFTEGQSDEDAPFNAVEVFSAMLMLRLDKAQHVPAPSPKVGGAHSIAPDAKYALPEVDNMIRAGVIQDAATVAALALLRLNVLDREPA